MVEVDGSEQPLDREILTHLESAWDACRAPIASRLSGGLPDDVIESSLAAEGLVVPEEIRAWWAWQNGAVPPTTEWVSPAPSRFFMSLADAIGSRKAMIEVAGKAAEAWDVHPDELWSPTWLPILRGQSDFLVCDCSVRAGLSPVRWVSNHEMNPDEMARIRVGSLGDLVQIWIDSLQAGLWRYVPENGLWFCDTWSELPEEIRLTGAFR